MFSYDFPHFSTGSRMYIYVHFSQNKVQILTYHVQSFYRTDTLQNNTSVKTVVKNTSLKFCVRYITLIKKEFKTNSTSYNTVNAVTTGVIYTESEINTFLNRFTTHYYYKTVIYRVTKKRHKKSSSGNPYKK